jgi:peptidoglycan/xylan/chitin deacetylase (PgdA/CDA1 family)
MATEQRLVVLMYHGLQHRAADPGRFDPRYSVRPNAFAAQLDCLLEARGDAWLPSADSLPLLPRGDQPAVMISFDDGDVSNALQALPALQQRGLRAQFFVTSGFVDQAGMLSRRQLRALADAGMAIGAHGASHRFLSTLTDAELQRELRDSRERLEQMSGQPVRHLALPGGRGGARELAAARDAGYLAVFGSQPGDNHDWTAEHCLQRIAISRSLQLPAFRRLLDWRGPPALAAELRHRLLRWPKRWLGDDGYDRLRQALVR